MADKRGWEIATNDDSDALERIRADKYYIWCCRVIEIGLFSLDCDPFAIHQYRTRKRRQTKTEPAEQEIDYDGRLFGNYYDNLRRKWGRFILVSVAYMCAKCMSVMLFRGLISLTESREPKFVHGNIKRVFWYVGDPFSSLSQVSVLLYVGSPFACGMARCALAYEFARKRPLDSSFVRFVLNPAREMHRIDLDTGEQIDQAIGELAKYRQDVLDVIQLYQRFEPTLINHTDPAVQSTLAGWQRSLVRANNQFDWLKLLRTQTHMIRQKAFSFGALQSYYLWFLAGYSVVGLGSSVTVMSAELLTDYINWIARCEEIAQAREELEDGQVNASNNSLACSLFNAFTWPEWITLVEINVLSQVNLSFTWMYLISIHFLQVLQLNNLTKNISRELDRLLKVMREFDNSPRNKLRDEQLGEIDCLLYTNIMSLYTHERELSAATRFMEIVMSLSVMNVVMFTVVLFSVLGSNSVANRRTQANSMLEPVRSIAGYEINVDTSIAAIIWLAVWLVVNCIILPVASIPVYVRRMKLTIHSVMAQICRLQLATKPHKLILQHRRASQNAHRTRGCPSDLSENDPLARLWRRFVLSKSFAIDHHTAAVFDIDITYKNIIELNLSVTTIISILTARG